MQTLTTSRVAGLIFMTAAILLGFLFTAGLSGPILLFAMSPALSVGLVGAAVVAGLKFMYPDADTTMGRVINGAVDLVFSPITLLITCITDLMKPITLLRGIYASYVQQQQEHESLVAVAQDIDEMDTSPDYAMVKHFNSDVICELQKYLTSEFTTAINHPDKTHAEREIAVLKAWVEVFKDNGAEPSKFQQSLRQFTKTRYALHRKQYLSDAKNSQETMTLRLSKQPAMSLRNIVDINDQRQDLERKLDDTARMTPV